MAQLLPLLPTAVDPDAEAHEDYPAGSTDACDERRLLHHVRDLLRQAHAVFLAAVAGANAAAAAVDRGLLGRQLCGEATGGKREKEDSSYSWVKYVHWQRYSGCKHILSDSSSGEHESLHTQKHI